MPYIIAEIGSNWDGDIKLAKDTIEKCYHAGADAVKFQLWKQDIIYPHKPEFKKWEMSFDQFQSLYEFAKKLGILCFATPSYPEAVDFLESLHVPLYKIASITSAQKHYLAEEVMREVADTGKPVLISCGLGDRTGNIFNCNSGQELVCVSEYPASKEKYLNKMLSQNNTNISDHTLGTDLMFYSIQSNPNSVIEKHVKLRDNSSPDSPFSLYVDELAHFISLSNSSMWVMPSLLASSISDSDK